MKKKNIIKMIILNAVIAFINILLFSNAFIHVSLFGENIILAAFSWTVVSMSVIVFGYGNYKLLNKKEEILRIEDIKTFDDCLDAINSNKGKKTFSRDLDTITDQIKRFKKKKETIKDILLQKFSDTEMSYSSFQNIIDGLEKVMYLNVRSILNRINAFDDEEYELIKKKSRVPPMSQSLWAKLEIYNEYISFVTHGVEDNEQIILKLDKLLLEISKFNSIEIGEIENMSAMQEIDELIGNAKWYK